ncbi:MAG: fumarate reductase/succinate dehydrogenase flavoprotein subunit [Bacteriovoracaceae bacterium]|jgi:succinate dehydrogenase / fumarate reductase, flavoprotein subunit|nr:fumarate reductase/succinate dehydrogenase flavoprotein subunit [Bacteriovoracaceae bacterium]
MTVKKINGNVPQGDIKNIWEDHKFKSKLVNPSNKRKYNVIVVGTGLAGASAAATLAELGYHIKSFCIQDSPRRAHSIAAQGGINAAKNYPNDGDSIWRLFYDTVKGGDYRSREANVYRLASVANNIIDQAAAQGVPFARDYGGYLANRSFGGAQVSRTFYARGQTGQQLLLGAYSSLMKEVSKGKIELFTRREMIDLVLVNGKTRGIIVRNIITGEIERYAADAVLLCTGGYGNTYYLSTNAMASNASAAFRAYKKGAYFANPCFTQIHPTCIPVHGENQSKLTLMSESLRNDGRVWVPEAKGDKRPPNEIPDEERDYYLERIYPSFGNLVPRDVASRNAKNQIDAGKGVGVTGVAVYLDFRDAIKRDGVDTIKAKYGNLFDMYERITDENPYQVPMKIYPAVHYTMGGLWVDYNLMSNVPGLFVLGEANFSDHGANRLGASALMQGLADGYFVIPYTLGNYLATDKTHLDSVTTDQKEFEEAESIATEKIQTLLNINGSRTVDDFHKELGHIMWEHVGMSRNESGLKTAIEEIKKLRAEFWKDVKVTGMNENINLELEKANRVADFLELGELMARDALERKESAGGHFREESQTEENEAKRDDDNFCHVAAWEFNGVDTDPIRNIEELSFTNVALTQRSYK